MFLTLIFTSIVIIYPHPLNFSLHLQIYDKAARIIQRTYRSYIHQRLVFRYSKSTVVIQRAFKRYITYFLLGT